MGFRSSEAIALALVLGVSFSVAPTAVSAGGSGLSVVDDDGRGRPGDCESRAPTYRRIQPALDASGSSDTVLVCPGTYLGELRIRPRHDGLILRSIVLRGATILSPSSPKSETLIEVDRADGVTLAGFRIRPRGSGPRCRDYGSVIAIRQSEGVVIRDNAIRPGVSRTTCAFANGVLVHPEAGTSSALIAGNTIRDFTSSAVLLFPGEVSARVAWNRIRFIHRQADEPRRTSSGGVVAFADQRVVIHGNDIRGRSSYRPRRGITVISERRADDVVRVSRNVVEGTGYGISVSFATGATIVRNEIHDSRWAGIGVLVVDRGTIADNRLQLGIHDGIVLGSRARGVQVTGNIALRFGGFECVDEGEFSSTNRWVDNVGRDSEPAGLCRPPTRAP